MPARSASPRATRSWFSWETSWPVTPSSSARQSGTLPYRRTTGVPSPVRYKGCPCLMTWPADGSQVSVPPPCPRTGYDPAYPSVAVTGVVAARSCLVTAAVAGGGPACAPAPAAAAGENAPACHAPAAPAAITATTPRASQRPCDALVATRISVAGAPATFADAAAQLDGGRTGGGLDQQVRAGAGR